jgi:hypothetical protein
MGVSAIPSAVRFRRKMREELRCSSRLPPRREASGRAPTATVTTRPAISRRPRFREVTATSRRAPTTAPDASLTWRTQRAARPFPPRAMTSMRSATRGRSRPTRASPASGSAFRVTPEAFDAAMVVRVPSRRQQLRLVEHRIAVADSADRCDQLCCERGCDRGRDDAAFVVSRRRDPTIG